MYKCSFSWLFDSQQVDLPLQKEDTASILRPVLQKVSLMVSYGFIFINASSTIFWRDLLVSIISQIQSSLVLSNHLPKLRFKVFLRTRWLSTHNVPPSSTRASIKAPFSSVLDWVRCVTHKTGGFQTTVATCLVSTIQKVLSKNLFQEGNGFISLVERFLVASCMDFTEPQEKREAGRLREVQAEKNFYCF